MSTLLRLIFFMLILFTIFIRLVFIKLTGVQKWIEDRVEISTPLTSWKRVLEGIYLKNNLQLTSAYDGDLVHELPVMLNFYEYLINTFDNLNVDINYVFVVFDIINALFIYLCARNIVFFLKFEELMDLKAGKFKRFIQQLEDTKDDNIKQKIFDNFLLKGYFNCEIISIFRKKN
jgi:GPI-anchor transamidase subunit U